MYFLAAIHMLEGGVVNSPLIFLLDVGEEEQLFMKLVNKYIFF